MYKMSQIKEIWTNTLIKPTIELDSPTTLLISIGSSTIQHKLKYINKVCKTVTNPLFDEL